MSEDIEVVVARVDERLGAVERDIKEIKAGQIRAEAAQVPVRPAWPATLAALCAMAALILTLIERY